MNFTKVIFRSINRKLVSGMVGKLSLGPLIRGKIRRVLHKTRLKYDAKFPYKRHISSKIRRGFAKTRLIR